VRAAVYRAFQSPLAIENVPDPTPTPTGVVLEVKATGVCRSDWHGWMGHDADITLPHVPGHELAGVVVAVGKDVRRWKVGARVTLPFVCGCGACEQCLSGNQQVCDHQFQPGFTHWGSYAEYVAIHYADVNLVALPEELDFVTAASLGCRFATAFRAIVAQGQVGAGQWVAVHGCGGVGLSAIMIATALDAQVIAIDIDADALRLAQSVGALHIVNASEFSDVVAALRELSDGGVHVSLDALGSPTTCFNSVASLRKRGKHVQVGLLAGDDKHPPVPMDQIVAHELELLGSHGMQAHQYPAMLEMIATGKLRPEQLVGATIDLEQAARALGGELDFTSSGVTVIDRF